jgi:simple sugar transport system permease protein
MQPIVATLILMVAGRGIAQLITEGAILTFNHPGLIFIGSGAFAGLPMPVLIWLALGTVVTLAVRRSALGLLIEATGINRRASTLCGINSLVLLLAVYAVSGFCAAVAGVIVAADIKGADAILAVVIGGTSLLGGRFSIVASLLGAMIIQSINTGILLSGFPPEFNLIIKAAIIVVILVLQSPAVQTLYDFLRSPPERPLEVPRPLPGEAEAPESLGRPQ